MRDMPRRSSLQSATSDHNVFFRTDLEVEGGGGTGRTLLGSRSHPVPRRGGRPYRAKLYALLGIPRRSRLGKWMWPTLREQCGMGVPAASRIRKCLDDWLGNLTESKALSSVQFLQAPPYAMSSQLPCSSRLSPSSISTTPLPPPVPPLSPAALPLPFFTWRSRGDGLWLALAGGGVTRPRKRVCCNQAW